MQARPLIPEYESPVATTMGKKSPSADSNKA